MSSSAESSAGNDSAESGLRKLLRPYLRGHAGRLAVVNTTSFFGALAEAMTLVIVARVAFALTTGDESVKANFGPFNNAHISLWTLIGIAGVLVVARFALLTIQIQVSTTLVTQVLVETRRSIVASFLQASWPLQSKEREGQLQELVGAYAGAASTCVSYLVGAIAAGLSLVALLATSFVLNPVASISVVAGALLLTVLLQPLRLLVRQRAAAVANAQLAMATEVSSVAGTAQEIKVFDVGQTVEERIGKKIDTHGAASHAMGTLSGLLPGIYQSVAMGLVVTGLAAVYAAGVTRLASIGAIVLIMVRALSYAQGLQTSYQRLHEQAPYLETLQREQARYADSIAPSGSRPISSVNSIAFEHVSFEYRLGESVLHDVSFVATCGEMIGIVGPSGAGKSTLVQLLLRLREPSQGRVLVDGVDITEIDLSAWRRHVTFVPQEPHLFDGTVADNIRFFRDASDDEVERATALAHLHEEVVKFPQGYNTPVGPRGGSISGGQRQRLCIARALLADPELVVLDEPTSALDTKSESLIRQTLNELGRTKTIFVIAHRLSTLQMCDRIMVIQHGRLQGFDDPDSLEASSPFYREALELSGLQ